MTKELVSDPKDDYQLRKLHKLLLDDGRITEAEHQVLIDALKRFHDATAHDMIDID